MRTFLNILSSVRAWRHWLPFDRPLCIYGRSTTGEFSLKDGTCLRLRTNLVLGTGSWFYLGMWLRERSPLFFIMLGDVVLQVREKMLPMLRRLAQEVQDATVTGPNGEVRLPQWLTNLVADQNWSERYCPSPYSFPTCSKNLHIQLRFRYQNSIYCSIFSQYIYDDKKHASALLMPL